MEIWRNKPKGTYSNGANVYHMGATPVNRMASLGMGHGTEEAPVSMRELLHLRRLHRDRNPIASAASSPTTKGRPISGKNPSWRRVIKGMSEKQLRNVGALHFGGEPYLEAQKRLRRLREYKRRVKELKENDHP